MSDPSPRANRLATPRWLDTRLVLGVLLLLASVIVGARVFAAAGRYTPVYVARSPLTPGERLRSGDLSVARVRFAAGTPAYVLAGSREPVGYLVTRYVGAGELVPVAALSGARGTAAATRLVTVPVATGHLPDDLAHGDLIDLYLTPKGSADASGSPQRILTAVVVDSVDGGSADLSGGSSVGLGLLVPVDRVTAVVQAVESGVLDVVRVPDSQVGSMSLAAGSADR